MAALQNRSVKQPNPNSGHHLHVRQWSPRKKPAHNPKRVKGKAQPKQPRDSRKKIGERRGMIKNGMQLMSPWLGLLQAVHDAGDACESETTVGQNLEGSAKMQARS